MCRLAALSIQPLVGAWVLLAQVPAPVAAHPPAGVVVDQDGTVFYLSTVDGHIRRLSPDGARKTFVPLRDDGQKPSDPHKLTVDARGNLYPSGWGDIWRVGRDGEVSVLLPSVRVKARSIDGSKTEDTHIYWNTPLAVDSKGNLYCINYDSEEELCRILRVDPDGDVRVVAGDRWGHRDGTAADARFHNMVDAGMAIGPDDVLYLTDGVHIADGRGFPSGGASCVRRVTLDGEVSTLAGSAEPGFADGAGAEARFRYAVGLAVDADGNVYVADSGNRRIRKVTPQGVVTTIAGSGEEGHADGPALEATFTRPTGVAFGPKGELYILDSKRLRMLSDGRIRTLE